MLLLKWLCDKLPASLEGLKPVLLYPFFGILGIGAVITFVVNPPVSALNAAISNGLINMGEASGILLGVVLAAMMGFSRLYVGVHFPSDVLAGVLVGLFCGWLACLLWQRFAAWKGLEA